MADEAADAADRAAVVRLSAEAGGGQAGSAEVRLRRAGQAPEAAAEPYLVAAHPLASRPGSVLWMVNPMPQDSEAAAPQPIPAGAHDAYRRFFDAAPMGFALLDAEGAVLDCNAGVVSLAGIERPGPGALMLADLVREDHRAAVGEALELSAQGHDPGEDTAVEVHMAGPEGTVCALHLSHLEATEDAPAGFLAHFIDTTQQKSLEVQFAQSQKMQAVGQLAGGIAHDFNNLLTAMIGFSDLLLLRHRPGDQSFADIMHVKQNANRAAGLVRQLLAFSRQQTLQPRVLDVTDILAELSHLLRRLIGETIELKMVHGRDLGPVKADMGQLEQVIINLAVNARDAMSEGGTLTIETDNVHFDRPLKRKGEVIPAGEYTRVKVSDTGHGIPGEDLDRIFEPFYSTKEVGAGTGLGLSTVYGIVSQTGGFVDVDSHPERGTAFSIYLPHHEASEEDERAAVAAAEASRDLTGAGTVLLVEDEDAVRAFGARALRNKGYNVLEANSGESALELLNEQHDPIDLLITDVVMPRLDGPALVREVRETRPALPVIFISGYAEDSFRKRLGQDTRIHFLPKPFSLKELAGKVKEVMRDAAA
jgi:two-component system cell cycle sensor histidine kinase/response regulator CckA